MLLRGSNISAVEDRAIVVHESVHIIVDMRRIPVVEMDDEAAGFLAMTWYLINLHADPIPILIGSNPSRAAGAAKIVAITEGLMARAAGMGYPVSVTQQEREDIHRALIRRGSYTWENTTPPDGIRHGRP